MQRVGIFIVTEFYGPRQAAFWWGIFVVAVILGGWYRYLRYRERQLGAGAAEPRA